MAEAVVIIGVVAAAAQFIEVGCRSVRQASVLISRFNDTPRSLRTAREQVQSLLQLAELVSKKTSTHLAAEPTSTLHNPMTDLKIVQSPLWQESAWRRCTKQAKLLEEILGPLLSEATESRIHRVWKRVSSLKGERAIQQIVEEIERQKSILNLWYAQECLGNINALKGLAEDDVRQLICLRLEVDELKSEFIKWSNRQDPVTKNARMTCKEEVPRQQRLQKRCKALAETSTDDLHISTHLNATKLRHAVNQLCMCATQFESLDIRFPAFRMLFQHTQRKRGFCPIHSDSLPLVESSTRYQACIKSGTRLFGVTVDWDPWPSSIGITLRAEIRTKQLPLVPFFEKLYRSHLCREKIEIRGFHTFVNREPVDPRKQDYLLSVVEKMLQQVFTSGKASPLQVDAQGRTLLHLQMDLCWSYDLLKTFLPKIIRLLLSMGVKPDVENDDFLTAQQCLFRHTSYYSTKFLSTSAVQRPPLDHSLIAWTPSPIPRNHGAIKILDYVIRWPESALELGYSWISDIVLRRSICDLKACLPYANNPESCSVGHATPLHFAAAASWLEGAEFLLAHGLDRHEEDASGSLPLDIAVAMQCVPLVELFLSGDCTPYFCHGAKLLWRTLPTSFFSAIHSDHEGVQDAIVEALARNRSQLQDIWPYHDLANSGNVTIIAEKLFGAGFQDIENYDDKGRTPLICACYEQNRTLVAFLLKRGADPRKQHRDIELRPGHFLLFDAERGIFGRRSPWSQDCSSEEASKLLRAAFDAVHLVKSTCRCSPTGYSPVHSTARDSQEGSCARIQNFRKMMEYLKPDEWELELQWQCLVRLEIFNRLELTHTCLLSTYPEVSSFAEDNRVEIEEEEEELYQQLEEMLADYSGLRSAFTGSIEDFNMMFLENLDHLLYPEQPSSGFGSIIWAENDPDLLGPGRVIDWHHRNSRGKLVVAGHREGIQEGDMLSLLFS